MIEKLIDLDAVLASTAEITLKLKGETHTLVPATVETFIANAKDIAAMAKASGDAISDLELGTRKSIEILHRSWPTVPKKELAALTLVALQKLVVFTRRANGEEGVTEATTPVTAPEKPADGVSAPAGAQVPSIGSEAPTAPQAA